MSQAIAPQILRRSYELDGPNLDRVASLLGTAGWGSLTSGLIFQDGSTGGGCLALTAQNGAGPVIVITDGEAGLPVEADQFYLGIETGPEEVEVYGISVIAGMVVMRSGSLAGTERTSLF